MLAFNPINALINDTITSMSSSICNGSGILLLFNDSYTHSVSINGLKAITNLGMKGIINCHTELQQLEKGSLMPVIHAAGLTVLYIQQNCKTNVNIDKSYFYDNFGTIAGAMLLFQYNSIGNVFTKISKTTFTDNYSIRKCPGAGLSFIQYSLEQDPQTFFNHFETQPLIVSNCTFYRHGRLYIAKNSAAILIVSYNPPAINITVKLSNVLFLHNYATIFNSPSCLQVYTKNFQNSCHSKGRKIINKNKNIKLVLENITAYGNAQFKPKLGTIFENGVFAISNIKKMYMLGLNKFTNNIGPVFNVTDTEIVMSGNLHFDGNKAKKGSAFYLQGVSRLYLSPGLQATFTNNAASSIGGVIYAHGSNCKPFKFDRIKCMCLFQTAQVVNFSSSMLFINNTAIQPGNDIMSNNMYNCYIGNRFYNISKAKWLLHSVSNGTIDNGISTMYTRPCICHLGHCVAFYGNVTIYPGQTIQIPVTAIDKFGEKSYSEMSLKIAFKNLFDPTIKYLIQQSSWKISIIKKTLMPRITCIVLNVRFTKKYDIPLQLDPYLVMSSSTLTHHHHKVSFKLNLISDCPLGFQFNHQGGKCVCSPILTKLNYNASCNIKQHITNNLSPIITITASPFAVWIGLINNGGEVFGVSRSCNLFCNSETGYSVFIVNNSKIALGNPDYMNSTVPLCIRNREGPLCSQCSPGSSVTFGSNECKKCSNWWLLSLLLYIIAGPLLIYLLYALKMTLTTGTLNGIIFYVQIITIMTDDNNSYLLLRKNFQSIYLLLTRCFISLFNLKLAFNYPLCLYNGMNELWKSGITLAYPFYLLTIVIGLIVISRYSVRLSNTISQYSVQVLITVVHLSFSRLLMSTKEVFTSNEVHTNTTSVPLIVWFKDATVEYGKDGHLVLMIITSLTVGPILSIYMIILLAGRLLLRINWLREYLRPAYEAIHAPYKRNKELFFSARMLIVILIYILYIQLGEEYFDKMYLIFISVLTGYCFLETSCAPYKLAWLNNLDRFIQMVLLILSALTLYWLHVKSWNGLIISLCTATLVIMMIFILIVIGHCLWVKGILTALVEKVTNLQIKIGLKYKEERNTSHVFSSLREPLLSP